MIIAHGETTALLMITTMVNVSLIDGAPPHTPPGVVEENPAPPPSSPAWPEPTTTSSTSASTNQLSNDSSSSAWKVRGDHVTSSPASGLRIRIDDDSSREGGSSSSGTVESSASSSQWGGQKWWSASAGMLASSVPMYAVLIALGILSIGLGIPLARCAASAAATGPTRFIEVLVHFWPAEPVQVGEEWNYALNGADWGKNFPLCSAGLLQSPIALPEFPKIGGQATYRPVVGRFPPNALFAVDERPTGHPGFQVFPEPSARQAYKSFNISVTGGPTGYFSQFHFHAPSEHTIGGVLYPLELHLVTTDSSGGKLAIGILFPLSDTHYDSFDSFFWEMHVETHNITGINIGNILDAASLDYYTYQGSLTSPPCNEGVTWIVFKSDRGISPLQLVAYQYALAGVTNYRGLEPINGRVPQLMSSRRTK